jgi:hypothetical protein
MAWAIGICTTILAAFAVDWGQRRCERWAQTRDKDL